ncbi:MAG: hypothetical protein KIPDCIKN_00334 [Haliscomenobacter sp.]|nr:hypothetical protein [Haliscomenobacter sp.]
MHTGFFHPHQELGHLRGAASSEDWAGRDGAPQTRRRKAILLPVALFICIGLQAQAPQAVSVPVQSAFRISGKSIPELRREEMEQALLLPIRGIRLSAWPIGAAQQTGESGQAERFGPLQAAQAFSPRDLAFFCRIEWRLEKAARFPIRIRLGEVQYVDQMEGKH